MPSSNSAPLIEPLVICGLPACGKSTLISLLDGSPACITVPFHDNFAALLGYLDVTDEFLPHGMSPQYRQVRCVLGLLGRSGPITELELAAHAGCYLWHQTHEGRNPEKIPFAFNYGQFRHDVISMLLGLEEVEPSGVFDVWYRAIHTHLKLFADNQARYGVSMLGIEFFRYYLLDAMYGDNMKMIYIDRPVLESFTVIISASFWGSGTRSEYTKKLAEEGAFLRYLKNRTAALEYAKMAPHKMLIVTFSDLIVNTEKTMQQIAAWLDVPFTQKMLIPSCLGHEISTPALGEVFDTPMHDLPESELAALRDIIDDVTEQAKRELAL